MSKLRKVIFFDEPVSFVKELKRGSALVNEVLKQVFTGSAEENLALAMDLLNGKKKLEIRISTAGGSRNGASRKGMNKQRTIKVNIRKEGKEKGVRPHGKKKSLLDDLSEMAKDFGE